MSIVTVNPKATPTPALRTLLASHPFVAFFVLAFAGSWLFFAPMLVGQDGLGLLPYHVPFWLYVVLFLGASFSGPTLAALVVIGAVEGKVGIKRFWRRYGQWRVGWRWYAIFLIGFPALYLLSTSIWLGRTPWQALIQQWPTFFTVYLPAVLLFPAIINWGEEGGWRGFAQTQMQPHYGSLRTSLVVGLLHGLWHLPVFILVTGPAALGPFDLGNFLLNTLMIMVLTIIWTWVFNGAQQSILIAALIHAAFNATQAWVGTLLPPLSDEVNKTITFVIVGSALLLILLTKGRLGYRQPNLSPQSTSQSHTPLHLSLRRLIARHPVPAFLLLAFVFAWMTMIPVLLSQQGFGVLPINLPVKLFNALASYIGLALPAFLVTAAISGRTGVRDLLQRSVRWRVGLQWHLVALFGLFTVVLITALPFVGWAPLTIVAQKWQLLFTVFLPGVLVPFLLINWPEEIAWTGFLQAKWQHRYGPLWASILVAPLFALIHLPAYFVAGWINAEPFTFEQYPVLLLQIGLTILFSFFFRLLIMWLYNGTGGSLLLVGLFHSAFNMSSGQQITPTFIPGPGPLWLNLFVVAVVAVAAVLITISTRGRLAYKPTAEPASAEAPTSRAF